MEVLNRSWEVTTMEQLKKMYVRYSSPTYVKVLYLILVLLALMLAAGAPDAANAV